MDLRYYCRNAGNCGRCRPEDVQPKKNLANLLLFTGGFALSYLFLYLSLDFLDMSIAYAVWMGLGTAGAVTINMIFFGESRRLCRIVSVGLIIIGVVGLKMVS